MMLRFYSSLKEKERHHFAAQEVQKLGYGSKSYISGLLKISPKTIRKGEAELGVIVRINDQYYPVGIKTPPRK